MPEDYTIPCRPHAFRQIAECVPPPDEPHTMHRKLTELALFTCNCGYCSGWKPVDQLPLTPVDFIMLHGGAELLEAADA